MRSLRTARVMLEVSRRRRDRPHVGHRDVGLDPEEDPGGKLAGAPSPGIETTLVVALREHSSDARGKSEAVVPKSSAIRPINPRSGSKSPRKIAAAGLSDEQSVLAVVDGEDELIDEDLFGRGHPEVVVGDVLGEWRLGEAKGLQPSREAHRAPLFRGPRPTSVSTRVLGGSKWSASMLFLARRVRRLPCALRCGSTRREPTARRDDQRRVARSDHLYAGLDRQSHAGVDVDHTFEVVGRPCRPRRILGDVGIDRDVARALSAAPCEADEAGVGAVLVLDTLCEVDDG